MKKIKESIFLILILVMNISNVYASGDMTLDMNNIYYFSDFYNTGHDNGYSEKNQITQNDLHYGWKLGSFAINGFSAKNIDENGSVIFLKTIGDEITLYFNLEQDINKLNGNEKLYIAEDKNGYDNEFQIDKTNFKKGTLIIKKTNYQNKEEAPQIYIDYLSGVKKGANTKIDIFEEGDYEVALDYEIVNDGVMFFNDYENYRIRFNFSIRNGNCMVFPIDLKTGQELTNTSITENGFKLDLAKSKYLDINIKREIYKDGVDGLIEDTRYNRPAKDGDEFSEEGIYTITVKNPQTNEQTVKKIYVGKDKLMKAHVQTGYSIKDLKSLLEVGVTINANGNIENIPYINSSQNKEKALITKSETTNDSTTKMFPILIPIIIGIIIIVYRMFYKNKEEKEIRIIEQELIEKEEQNINIENEKIENKKESE